MKCLLVLAIFGVTAVVSQYRDYRLPPAQSRYARSVSLARGPQGAGGGAGGGGAAAGGGSVGAPAASNTNPPWKCQRAGTQCKSCSTAVNCMDIGATDLIEVETAQCVLPETCNAGECKVTKSWECSGANDIVFPCTAPGCFPDPNNCRNYQICVKDGTALKAFKTECTGEFSYDPSSTYCKNDLLSSATCAALPIPLCEVAGQTAALTTNPSIFYICMKMTVGTTSVLYPKQFLCANGKIYNNGKCEKKL